MIINGISNLSFQQNNTLATTENRVNAAIYKGSISATDRESTQTTPPKTESSSVNLSSAAVKLHTKEGNTRILANIDLPEISEKDKTAESPSVKSFAYGALGMDHPDKVQEKEDDSYSAGQYFKAVATLGSMIALFV